MDNSLNVKLNNCEKGSVISFAVSELNRYMNIIYPRDVLEEKYFFFNIVDSGFRFDGYSVEEDNNIISFSASMERGLLYAVYAFLRKTGCSFLFPLPEKQYIPKLTSWKTVSLKQEPYMEYRGICLYNTVKETIDKTCLAVDWMAKNGFNFLLTSIHRTDDTGCNKHAILWDEIGDELLPEIEKRGIVIDMSEHSTDFYFPRNEVFKKHPEWFAEVDGVREPGQICYSNLDAVDYFADSIVDFVKDKPWFKFFGIWPLDGGGYCQCEKCKNPQTIFEANSKIANKIKAVRPDLTVEHLAYTPQSFPRPKEKMPQNMSVLVCHLRNNVAYEWSVAAQDAGGAFYFDYMTADHYRFRSNVIFNPTYCRETVNALISYKFRGVVSLYLPVDCWFQSSLNLFYLSQLYYDPTKSIDEITLELSAELFGKENAQQGAVVLNNIANEIFDKTLWSGYSFAHEWYNEHLMNRSRELDALHALKLNSACDKVISDLENIKTHVKQQYEKNTELLISFVEIQKLFYNCVDSYNAKYDTPLKAEPYFEKLKKLNAQLNSPFISHEYARWRITGRDNIFDTSAENLYQV